MSSYVVEKTSEGKWQVRETGKKEAIATYNTSEEARNKMKELLPTKPADHNYTS